MKEKERYATTVTWSKYFKEKEGISISHGPIRKRLKAAGIIGRTAKNSIGRVQLDAFFAESDVRRLCQDLLERLLHANEEGVIELDGEVYGPVIRLSKLIGVSTTAIRSRINANTPSIKGKTKDGQVKTFYPESKIKMLCQDLLGELPQANNEGFVELDGEFYGTIRSLARRLCVDTSTIQSRITENTPHIRGKAHNGVIRIYYQESEVRKCCQDVLGSLPTADADGYIRLGDKNYGTIAKFASHFSVSSNSIKLRISKNTPSIRGRAVGGQIQTFYLESAVHNLCRDLFEDLPHANADGFFELNGETYGTVVNYARLYGISDAAIKLRISKKIPSIQGRARGGNIHTYYPQSIIQRICADLISKRKKK